MFHSRYEDSAEEDSNLHIAPRTTPSLLFLIKLPALSHSLRSHPLPSITSTSPQGMGIPNLATERSALIQSVVVPVAGIEPARQ